MLVPVNVTFSMINGEIKGCFQILLTCFFQMKRAISEPNLSGNGRLAAVQCAKQLQKCSLGTEGDVRKAE